MRFILSLSHSSTPSSFPFSPHPSPSPHSILLPPSLSLTPSSFPFSPPSLSLPFSLTPSSFPFSPPFLPHSPSSSSSLSPCTHSYAATVWAAVTLSTSCRVTLWTAQSCIAGSELSKTRPTVRDYSSCCTNSSLHTDSTPHPAPSIQTFTHLMLFISKKSTLNL